MITREDTPTAPGPGEPLRDQRAVFYGREEGIDPGAIEAAWEEHRLALAARGHHHFPERMGEGETLQWLAAGDELVAQVGTGRWVAACPYCAGGIALWQENPKAACLDCGRVFSSIKWPSKRQMADGVLALEARPDRLTRFWNPQLQKAKDLRLENIEHAIGRSEEDQIDG